VVVSSFKQGPQELNSVSANDLPKQTALSSELRKRLWTSAAAPIFGLVAFVVIMALGLLTAFAHKQDSIFEINSRQLVSNEIKGQVSNIRNIAVDWGHWNAAYQSITERWDEDWIEETFYSAMSDIVLIVRDGEVRHTYIAKSVPNGGEIIGTVKQSLAATSALPKATSMEIEIGGALAIVATHPIEREDGTGQVRDSFVIVHLLDKSKLTALGERLGLESFRLSDGLKLGQEKELVSLKVNDANLVWRHERPGRAAFSGLAMLSLALVSMAGILAWLVARNQVNKQIELTSAQQATQESSRLKSQFLATMSHELRTPLNAIIGYSEILEEDLEDAPEAARPDDARRIQRAAQHLLVLISEVLDFSAIESGQLKITNEPVDIEALLNDVEEIVRPTGAIQGNQVTVCIESQLPILVVDGLRFKQCLLNLASNACKFTKDGHVTINASIKAYDDGKVLQVVVADTGIGIKPGDQIRLFQPFIQVDSTETRAQDGTGLGLVITRKLAQAMGGDVTMSSAPGVGSTFTLTVAAVLADVAGKTNDEPQSSMPILSEAA
jgi:signal transduction histidine kinase